MQTLELVVVAVLKFNRDLFVGVGDVRVIGSMIIGQNGWVISMRLTAALTLGWTTMVQL